MSKLSLIALLAFVIFASNSYSQSLPPDTTTYQGTDITGRSILYRRPPDSLLIPGHVLIHFRSTALDEDKLAADYVYWYSLEKPEWKGKGKAPLSGEFARPDDPRGYPYFLRDIVLTQQFCLSDSTTNIVLDPALQSAMISLGGTCLHRLTAASPYDTLSVTRTGDTIGCDHFCWMILDLDSATNPLAASYLLSTYFTNQITGAFPDYRGGKLLGHPGDTAADGIYLQCQRNTRQINAEAAWYYEVGRPQIHVAVLDQGGDFRHPDFMDTVMGPGHKFYTGYDWDNNDSLVYRTNPGHGTPVCGIIGARTNNLLAAPDLTQSVAGIAGGWGTLPPMVTYRGPGVSLAIGAANVKDGILGFIASLFESSAFSPTSSYGWERIQSISRKEPSWLPLLRFRLFTPQ